jgi:hypothetical protein
MVSGPLDDTLTLNVLPCNRTVCNAVPPGPPDNGTWRRWSDLATWAGTKPKAGANVTIPATWRLIIDESPPPLSVLAIDGWVKFDDAVDVVLTATYVLVRGPSGQLAAGTAAAPHPVRAVVNLTGGRLALGACCCWHTHPVCHEADPHAGHAGACSLCTRWPLGLQHHL